MSILVVAAHPDDEVLGAGAVIARLAEKEPVHLLVLTDGVRGRFPGTYTSIFDATQHGYHEACLTRERECRAAAQVLGIGSVNFERFFDQQLDVIPAGRIAEAITRNLRDARLVLTHGMSDTNQDHRRACEATLIATRAWTLVAPIVYGYRVDPRGAFAAHSQLYVEVGLAHIEKQRRALESYVSEGQEAPLPRSSMALIAQRSVWGTAAGVEWAEAFELLQSVQRLEPS